MQSFPLRTNADTVVGNQDPSLTKYNLHTGPDCGFLGPDLVPNTPLSIGHAAGMDNDYNDNDDECDDDDNEDKEGDKAKEDSPVTAALFSQPVGQGINAPYTSQRKQQNNQQENTRASAQRQRQQQQQQQQQPQQQQQQQPKERRHAAVEKRYRSVLNSKIQQLDASIPALNTFSLTDSNAPPEDQGAGATQKVPTKSVVMDRAIQYLNHLVSTYEQYETERNELQRKLRLWLDDIPSPEMLE